MGAPAMTTAQRMWVFFLAGLPWASFALVDLMVWHSQTTWAHLWLVALFGLLLSGGGRLAGDRPFGWWSAWALLVPLVTFGHLAVDEGVYVVDAVMPMLHVLSIVAFVTCATVQWDAAFLGRLLVWLSRSAALFVAYCTLQAVGLDQFYRNLPADHALFTGTAGNMSLCAAFLALALPLFLLRGTRRWTLLAAWTGCLLAGMAVWHQQVGGPAAALVGVGYWGWKRSAALWRLTLLLGVAGIVLAFVIPELASWSGRGAAWLQFGRLWLDAPITGHGLGATLRISLTDVPAAIREWRHVHNEYLQVALEQGVVGLALVGWMIANFMRRLRRLPNTPLATALGAIGLAFLTTAAVTFSAHLWILGAFGLLAYCGIATLSKESACLCR